MFQLCVFQVQQSIGYLVDEALRMGAHPDDRDGVTDMTLLMFTCKAGAAGVGDGSSASKVSFFFYFFSLMVFYFQMFDFRSLKS